MTWVEGANFLWASVHKYLVLDIFHVLDLLDRLIVSGCFLCGPLAFRLSTVAADLAKKQSTYIQ